MNPQNILTELMSLTGLTRHDFATNKLPQARLANGTYVTADEIFALFEGRKTDRPTLSTQLVLQLLLENLMTTAERITKLPIEKAYLNSEGVRVEVKYRQSPSERTSIQEREKVTLISIVIDKNLSPQEALIQAVGEFGHEGLHPFANRLLQKTSMGILGVPTLMEEALTQRLASLALREMGLDSVADIIDKQVADRVVRLAHATALYVRVKDVSSDTAALQRVLNMVRESPGARNIILIAENDSEFNRVKSLAAQGVPVLRLDDLLEIRPTAEETIVQIHSRLFEASTRARLVVKGKLGANETKWRRLISLANQPDPKEELLQYLEAEEDLSTGISRLFQQLEGSLRSRTHV